ncbi:hypothetical protein CCP3SC1AL1_320028 [Gammaproteobacteria bacterium]
MSYLVKSIGYGEREEPKVFLIDIEKAKREGLIPVRRKVQRGDKSFEQTFWVKPKDLKAMNTKNAVDFMEGMVKAQQYFKSALEKAENALPDAAAAVYDKMMKSGKLTQKIGGLQLKIEDFSRQNQVSGDNLLAAIYSRPESEIPDKIKGIVNNLYKKVTTTNYGKQLQLDRKAGKVGSVRVSTETKPYKWEASKWKDKFKELISRKIDEVKSIFSARKKGTNVDRGSKDKKVNIEVKNKNTEYTPSGDLKTTFGIKKKEPVKMVVDTNKRMKKKEKKK